MKYTVLILIYFLSFPASEMIFSQGLHTSSNKALRTYHEAMTYYDYNNLDKAEETFRLALEYDPKFYEVHMMLGELYTKKRDFSSAAASYNTALSIDSLSYKPAIYLLANAEFMASDYDNALKHYKRYLAQPGIPQKNRIQAEKNIINSEFAIKAIKDPVSFNPENIGPGINTEDDEYWPSITADGQIFMFTRQLWSGTSGMTMGRTHEDFYVSYLGDEGWGKAFNAGDPLNTRSNEGAQTLSSNGTYMYFTACERSGGMGSCDLYYSSFREGKWSVPQNLKSPVNSSSWESTPSISADGTMLFFSSNRPGGKGGKDLWYSVLGQDGSWSDPVNPGDMINTPYDEMSPFIHFDGQTLYFASDGHPGMGGFDIYMTTMADDSSWTEPKNLGYPVNTSSDETGLVIDAAGQKAYFSSRRDSRYGKDIFFFELDESVRPNPVSYLKGRVTDSETGKSLRAEFELINLSTNKVTVKNTSDEKGNFMVCLPAGYNYGLNVTREGYLLHSESFMFEGLHTVLEPMVKRISLRPLKAGEKMLLSNVFYEVDSWELRKESMEELNNLADLIANNPGIIVEIGGYTDSTGTDEHNLVLSEKRALSVVSYLKNKGISTLGLKYRGYGNSSPIGDNVTYEGRKLNRRTEVKIISTGNK
ncbi:MAG TPA: OmpA family protein [Bacteroidales bacterium]|nr:OmpA family protein [Bacteroidales bacterium]HPR11238.1 OmpA family protein [Bacteroidales bacterium]